jgi:DNA repair exonuclease SbcCD nuclease subunit
MKIALLCDTHFGARNDSPIFLHHFFRFVDEVFLPYLDKEGITHIIHLGDLMDRRKFVNFATLRETRKRFIEPLKERRIHMTVLLGNHDTFFRNTSEINTVEELFGNDDSVTVVKDPREYEIGGTTVLLLPWINKGNEEASLNLIKNTSATIVMGHLELSGYEVLRGTKFEEGMDAGILKGFEAVYSGHFHCKHSGGNVHYLGTPYQITFNDLNEPKGFHIFETSDHSIKYVENPLRIFTELTYDDSANQYDNPSFPYIKNTFVRVKVLKKGDPSMFDRYMDAVNSSGAHGVTVIEDKNSGIEISQEVDISKDTLSIINQEIDQIEIVNPNKLKTIIRELYMESLFN